MGVRPFLSGLRALILEHGHIFEARVALQVRDAAGPCVQHALDLLVAHLRHRLGVIGRFDDNLVRAHGRHAVVDSLGGARGLAFDAVERAKMRIHAHLPLAVGRQIQE